MMNVKPVDVALYTAFRHLVDSGRMPKNELYYAILDWADQNQDVVNEYIKNTECYVVKCLTAKTIEEKKFTNKEYENPYLAAKRFFDETKDKCDSINLWRISPFFGDNKLISAWCGLQERENHHDE